MHARVSYYDLDGASRDDAVQGFERVRGRVEQMQGNRGAMLLVDQEGGRAISITLWEDEEALRASAEQANRAREDAAGQAGIAIRGVEAYEVALDFTR